MPLDMERRRAAALLHGGDRGAVSTDAEARHSADWYADVLTAFSPRPHDRMFIPCLGGPCASRLETFPPRLELRERSGVYVLVDEGPPEKWSYQFVSNA
jgi:hypothetical protein